MASWEGRSLGPYLVTARIGAGGMGDVYKGTDTRLHRTVAIKVLPPHFAHEPEARERFEREARTVAALNHPHICTVHDIGTQDGIDFLVMEHLDGETLAVRLSKGPLPLAQVFQIAAQVASALDRAHGEGVVHRDLKPGNIMLTKAGAKLLDFGLAKTRTPVGVGDTTRLTGHLTQPGMVLGTLQYMAPEQLEGKEVDERTDIFAFGSVLYEMLTGKKAFQGSSQASLIAAILDRDPKPISSLQAMTPPGLDRIVMKCLAKNPDERWQSVHDMALAIELFGRESASVGSNTVDRRPMAWVFGSLAVVTALTTVAVLNLGPADTIEKPVATSLSLLAPAQTAFIAGYTAPHLSVSPDGRTLAFVPMPIGGRALLWVRDLASPAPRQLAGTEGATFPFWSPDGRTIAFFADGQLKSIAVAGGAPHTICAAPDGRGGAWSPEGVIVFTPQLDGPLFRVDANGGQPVAATKLDDSRQEVSHRLPSFLPDGRRFLFLVQGGRPETSNVYVGRLDSLETDRLSVVASKAVYSAGHLLYRRDRSLVAHPFDADTLRLSGDPTTLTEVVATRSSVYGDMIFSEAAGTLAYWSGGQSTTRLTWLDRTGKPIEAVGTPAEHFSLSLSPDQKKVALEIIDPALQTGDIWVADVATGIKSRVTSGPGWDFGPKWSPDGSQVRFGSIRQGPANLYVKRSSGGETEQLFLKSSDFLGPTDWSADGHLFLFQNLTKYKVAALPLNGTQDSSFVLKSEYVEGDGTLSPDGKWLAYTSNESGSWDVYVQPYPSLDHKWRISPDGGSRPQWRRDSRELFYVGPDQQLMAVPVTADASFTAGAPVPLFPMRIIPLPPTQPRQQYAVSANGERFLVNTVLEPASPTPVTIVLNWSAAVEAKTR